VRIPLTRTPRAIIYDHDGTLVDTLTMVVEATNLVLGARGLRTMTQAEVFAGMAFATAPRMGLHARVADERERAALAEEFYAHANAIAPRVVRAYPGIDALLGTCARAGLAQGVVSNNQDVLIREIMRATGLDRHVGLIWGFEDVPAAKPDGRGTRRAAEALGCAPGDCIYVGDGATDVGAAHAAGMPIIGVTWGIHPRAELEAMGFDCIVDSVDELGARLEAWWSHGAAALAAPPSR
jgi:HAD superfamily hydrolase (TIGR01509 family)